MKMEQLQQMLCQQLCEQVRVVERPDRQLMIAAPFAYPDGDQYPIHLQDCGNGQVRLSDAGNTMMRLSYTADVEKYYKGARHKLMQQILREHQVQEDDGDIHITIPMERLATGILSLTQALSQIYDLSYLDRDRQQSTFYQDLYSILVGIADVRSASLIKDYQIPDMENAENYLIDYAMHTREQDEIPALFLFGVPSDDKARLVTITLQQLMIKNRRTSSLVIFRNQEELSRKSISLLMDAGVGGSQVSSIQATQAIEDNIALAIH